GRLRLVCLKVHGGSRKFRSRATCNPCASEVRPDERPTAAPLQRGVIEPGTGSAGSVQARWQELQRRGKAYRHVLPTFPRQLQDLQDRAATPGSPGVRRDAVE